MLHRQSRKDSFRESCPNDKCLYIEWAEAGIWVLQGVDVMLASDGSGQGRGGPEQKDVLPPLVPGMKARQQQ